MNGWDASRFVLDLEQLSKGSQSPSLFGNIKYIIFISEYIFRLLIIQKDELNILKSPKSEQMKFNPFSR